jgi:serine phosphatase RsbU (regulator of sigma subunit)/anti-sigma regulatory factor (Ser/Thr protein kinase)
VQRCRVGVVEQGSAVDFEAVVEALPTAYLILDPELRIAYANPAYLRNARVGKLDDIVGQPVFDVFPANPGDVEGEQRVAAIRAAFERARDTARAESMDIIKYDIPDGEGGFVERFWSLIHAPVLGPDGRVAYVMQRNEDVTEFVLSRERAAAQHAQGEQWRQAVATSEAELFVRAEELRSSQETEARAVARLASLAEVSLGLAGATSLQQLTDIVTAAGLTALGADVGVVAVLEGEQLRATFASRVSDRPRTTYALAPLDGPLPPSVVTRTGRPVVLRDRAASLAYTPQMRGIVEDFGMQATATLPLRTGAEILGALLIGWHEPQALGARDLELMTVLASQTAQALARVRTREAEAAAAAAVARLSETMQRSLLTDPVDPPGLDVAVRYQPAARELQVGGDWYDAFALGSGDTLLVVGDVAGHDQDAAAVMAQVRNILRGVAHVLGGSPAGVLTALDQALRDLLVPSLATAVLATVEQEEPGRDRVLRWSNAGHPPPVLIEVDGSVRLLDSDPDLLLGLDPATGRADHTATLPVGSTLLLYTDGLIERRGTPLDLGLAWLTGACRQLAGLPVEVLLDELLAMLEGDVEDDVALLAVRVLDTGAIPDVVFSRDPSSVSAAREHVRRACRAAGVEEDTCESAMLLTSEVVTNAVVHGRGRVRLHVAASPTLVRVEVGDDSSMRPVVRPTVDEDATGGRGMAIVEMLASTWGTRDSEVGKVVWFELDG